MAQAYRVCAPYVTVALLDDSGVETVRGFYEGGLLPGNAKPEAVEALIAKGMVEEADGPTLEEQADEDREAEAKRRENAKKVAEQVAAEDAKKAEKRAATAAAKQAELAGEPAEATEVPRPAANASKADWVAYAVSQRDAGVSEDDARVEAEGWSKNDLINMYGG